MLFPKLAQYLEKLEGTSSRNAITAILADLFKETGAKEIDKVCYLILGELLPSYRGIEFNIAEKIMIQVLAKAFDKTPEEINRRYRGKGDLGDVAYELASGKDGQAALTVTEIYDTLLALAKDSGEGSQERRIGALADLLQKLDRLSAKYVTRIPVGKLRLGFSDLTILDALSLLERGDKSARKEIEGAYNVTADIGEIARRVKKAGVPPLQRITTRPGIPIRPSLAERLKEIEEIFEKAGAEVGVEQKLDGFRSQIHVWAGAGKKQVALFSRNLENTTPMFPEIVEAAKKLKVKSAILDGETIGYNPQTGKFAPFQETVQRKRKYNIEEFAKKIPLYVFVFDLLHLNGKSLLHLPFRERRKILEKTIPYTGLKSAIRLADHKITSDPKEIAVSLKESIFKGLEGLVVKNLEVPYQAGSRGFHWMKLKATTAVLAKLRSGLSLKGLPDTIDCLIMGAYRGRGKRAQFGIGGLLLGVRGRDDKYYTISRLGTGLSDEQFREMKKRARNLETQNRPKQYEADKDLAPDIWFSPSLVAEILADEITLSPRHTAGRKGEKGRGYSLRFPRLVRLRDDKSPEDATTVAEIAKMFRQQK